MKKWIAVLVILCLGVCLMALSGCQKKQVEKQQTEPMGESMEQTTPDTTAMQDTTSTEMEEPMGEMAE